jgi:hypothetical protein
MVGCDAWMGYVDKGRRWWMVMDGRMTFIEAGCDKSDAGEDGRVKYH